jgi:hypothetical protein
MKNKIRIQLIEKCPNKLQFVKLIKDCTELGLKDSKHVCDRLHDRPDLIEEITVREGFDENGVTYSKKFINGMRELVQGKFNVTGGLQWDRNIKMLILGIGDESDYIDFINEFIIDNRNLVSETILRFALTKLSKEELQEVFTEINKTLI